MAKKRKVFITNPSAHDFESAEQYGELIPLTRYNVNLSRVDRMATEMLEKLKDSEPKDYLLIAGHAIPSMVASAIMMYLHNQVRMLIWDRRQERYFVRNISAAQFKRTIEFNFGKTE